MKTKTYKYNVQRLLSVHGAEEWLSIEIELFALRCLHHLKFLLIYAGLCEASPLN